MTGGRPDRPGRKDGLGSGHGAKLEIVTHRPIVPRTTASRTAAPRTTARGTTPTRRVAAIAAGILALGLVGCAGDVPMEPAIDANDPACANVVVRLPNTIAELAKRTTNAQATGAWGDPVAVELTCGIEPSGPTTDDCVSVDDVDWIIDRSAAPLYRFEAYGRSPGLQVVVDSDLASGTEALLALNSVAELLPQEHHCTSVIDNLEFE